jgi:hypothetical protein
MHMNMDLMICLIVEMCVTSLHARNSIFKNFCKPRDGKIEKEVQRGFKKFTINQTRKVLHRSETTVRKQ